jgi:hypothetical protein
MVGPQAWPFTAKRGKIKTKRISKQPWGKEKNQKRKHI